VRGALIEDYMSPVYRSLARAILSNFLLEDKRIPFFVAMDAGIVHYKRWTEIVFNSHVREGWRLVLERYYLTDAYRTLNEAVAGDPLLAKYAAIHFLNTLFKKSEEEARKRDLKGGKKGKGGSIDLLMEYLTGRLEKDPAGAEKVAMEVAGELEREAREVMEDLEVAQGFTHMGVPVAELLERPDEFREVARNRIVVSFVRLYSRFRREASLPRQAKAPALIGGRPLGAKVLQRPSELTRLLPSEFIDEDLLSYRIASKTAKVRESYGTVRNYVVYLDKSGSMAGNIAYYASPTQREYVPKISFAAAATLALADALRRVGARLTLKTFDTEVHDPITDPLQLVDVLLRIRADSGTNISRVLEDSLSHREERVVVVTDGIDRVDEDAVRRAKSAGVDVSFVFIETDNELLRRNFPCTYIREAKPTVLLEV
jgi:uncharacterized protein with von Willebrand factor type A (vWA) domain